MTAEPEMHDYTLNCIPDERRIEFRAKTVGEALTLAETLLSRGQEATLLEDGVALGRLTRRPTGYWTVLADAENPHELC